MANLGKREIVDRVISILSGDEFNSKKVDQYFAANARIVGNGMEISYEKWRENIEDMPILFSKITVDRVIEEDDIIAVWLTFVNKQTEPMFGIEPTEETFETKAVQAFEIKGGKIAQLEILEDREPAYEHLGLLDGDLHADIISNQYLSVLNRVLRHDLRTSVNLINAYAASLTEDTDTDLAEAVSQIQTVTGDLLDTAEKARTLQQAALDTEVAPQPVDVSAVVQEVTNDYTEQATLDIQPLTTDDITVQTDRTLLRIVLNELIENAVVHAAQSQPTVTVSVEHGPPTELVVADSGPGIPEEELVPIRTKEETQLLHGSGIGLWVVQWGVTRLHGELSFDTNPNDGTTVSIQLPDLPS